MDTESFDASRLFTTDTGPECSSWSCPKCDCDGRDVGETWYTEFQDDFDYKYGYASCAECTCYDGSWNGGNNYASCDYLNFYKIGEGKCPQTDEGLACYTNSYTEGGETVYYYGTTTTTTTPTYTYTGSYFHALREYSFYFATRFLFPTNYYIFDKRISFFFHEQEKWYQEEKHRIVHRLQIILVQV